MVAPVPAQTSKLPPRRRATPLRCRSELPLRLTRGLTDLERPTSNLCVCPSSAPRSVISHILSSFRILPVASGVALSTFWTPASSTNSFAAYHIPANPAVSCNYALFCATASCYPLFLHELAHSFHRHGGVPPFRVRLSTTNPRSALLSRLESTNTRGVQRYFPEHPRRISRLPRALFAKGVRYSRFPDALPVIASATPVLRAYCAKHPSPPPLPGRTESLFGRCPSLNLGGNSNGNH